MPKENKKNEESELSSTVAKKVEEVEHVTKDFIEKVKHTDFQEKAKTFLDTIKENFHLVIGIVLLGIGLYILRQWLRGILCIVFGTLFVAGFFKKDE